MLNTTSALFLVLPAHSPHPSSSAVPVHIPVAVCGASSAAATAAVGADGDAEYWARLMHFGSSTARGGPSSRCSFRRLQDAARGVLDVVRGVLLRVSRVHRLPGRTVRET